MKFVIAGALLFVLTGSVWTTEPKAPHPVKPVHKSEGNVQAAASLLTPFSDDEGPLKAGYTGVNYKRLHALISAKSRVIPKKGEFETSEEFAHRTADKDALLAPLSTRQLYAFQMQPIEVTYNADTQAFEIGSKYNSHCKEERMPADIDKPWVTCLVGSISRNTDSYIGTNSFGVKRKILRTVGLDFAIAYQRAEAPTGYVVQSIGHGVRGFTFQDTVEVPLEKARTLKDKKIAVLFVGHLLDARIIQGEAITNSPSVSDPTDIFIKQDAVPIEIKKIIYYVVPTGEVLAHREY